MAQGKRNEPTVEPSEADCWYAAGFIDGEGCITVRAIGGWQKAGWNQSCFASVTVSQVDPRPLQWLQERWGGSLRAMSARKERDRPAWEWCVVGQQAYVFLDGIMPMLKCKPEQAVNALRLREVKRTRGQTGHHRSLSPDELAIQQEIHAEAKRLNQRGRAWEVLP
jgi:hypothetical protein